MARRLPPTLLLFVQTIRNWVSLSVSTEVHCFHVSWNYVLLIPPRSTVQLDYNEEYFASLISSVVLTEHYNVTVNSQEVTVDCVWNVMAHAQKPDFFFRRKGRFHLNRRGASVQSTTGSWGVRISFYCWQ